MSLQRAAERWGRPQTTSDASGPQRALQRLTEPVFDRRKEDVVRSESLFVGTGRLLRRPAHFSRRQCSRDERKILAVVEKRGGWQPEADKPPPTVAPPKPEDAVRTVTPPRQRNHQHPKLNRIDQALRAAKNANRLVTFTLAVETPSTDEECQVSGHVVEVDKYDILLRLRTGTDIWFKRSAIVETKIDK